MYKGHLSLILAVLNYLTLYSVIALHNIYNYKTMNTSLTLAASSSGSRKWESKLKHGNMYYDKAFESTNIRLVLSVLFMYVI